MIKISKSVIDTNGHYARPDVLRLVYAPPSTRPAAEDR